MKNDLTQKSKYLAYILRHKPEVAQLTLDKEGWTSVELLTQNTDITLDELKEIVAVDDKGRYAFSPDGTKIRANQGHSTGSVKLTFKKAVPPTVLYHGTNPNAIQGIMKRGLVPMNRHHVHLSEDLELAKSVGGRRKGGAIILQIDAKKMLADGIDFYISDNGVWLVNVVHPMYIKELHET